MRVGNLPAQLSQKPAFTSSEYELPGGSPVGAEGCFFSLQNSWTLSGHSGIACPFARRKLRAAPELTARASAFDHRRAAPGAGDLGIGLLPGRGLLARPRFL